MFIFHLILASSAFAADYSCIQLQMGEFATGRSPIAAVEHFSTSFSSFREVPGLPGGLPKGATGRYIRTKWIPESILEESGFVSRELREPYAPNELIKEIKLSLESGIYLVSDDHSGSSAAVYVAELAGGRLVAVKAYDPNQRLADPLETVLAKEARAAATVSQLGIGPRFHGRTTDSIGRPALVFDIVSGDFIDMPVNGRTFADLETIFKRLRDHGLTVSGDVQLYRGAQGELGMIDPLAVTKITDPNRVKKEEHSVRLELLAQARLDVVQTYLAELAVNDPKTAGELRLAMKAYLSSSYTEKGVLPSIGSW